MATGRERVEREVLAAVERLGRALDEIRGGALTETACSVCGKVLRHEGQGRPRSTCKGACADVARRLYNRRYNATRLRLEAEADGRGPTAE